MEYVFLVISVLANGVKGNSSKLVGKYIDSSFENAKLNAIRAPICAFFSLILLLLNNQIHLLNSGGIWIAAISGISMAIFQMSWISAVKSGAYIMVGSFGTASFIVPLLLGVLFLNEQISVKKILAVLFILLAIYFMCCYNIKIKGLFTAKNLLILACITIFQGISQFLQKYYVVSVTNASVTVYNFYMFIFMGVFLLAYLIICSFNNKENTRLKKQVYLHIIIMSVALFAMTYFQTLAAKSMKASVLYPIINSLSLLVNFAMSTFLYKEKIKKEKIIGVLFIFVAVMLYL